jgi:hypothetical protein
VRRRGALHWRGAIRHVSPQVLDTGAWVTS